MLDLLVAEQEVWDEKRQEFVTTKPVPLQLEHSLVSLSRWESKWCKPFFSKEDKTDEQVVDYIRCMTITQHVSAEVFRLLPAESMKTITEYIDRPMTATWFKDPPGAAKNKEVITAEIIYYWMILHNIPMECQKWHLNRLMTLIRVCALKSSPSKKMSRKEMLAQRNALNASRRKQLGA